MEKLINDYSKHLSLKKSEGTIKQYQNDIKMFCLFMDETKFKIMKSTVIKIKIVDIYNFLYDLNIKGEKAATIRRKIAALKSFFNYLKKMQIIKKNVMLELDKEEIPKLPKRQPKYFTLEQCKLLINSVSGRNILRDKTIIKLFLGTGMRLSELISLNVNCVGKNAIRIIGKGNKERIIYPSEKVIESLKEYLKQRQNVKSNALFLSERENRISASTVQNVLKKAISNAGLRSEEDTDMLVHILRHTFATIQFQHGVDIRTIQKILGHESISTTQIYIGVAEEQMKKVSENNPLNNIF